MTLALFGALAWCAFAHAAYEDPDAAATDAAAEAAVAKLGAARSRAVSGASRTLVATVRSVPALVGAVGAGTRGLTANVQDLKQAVAALNAKESELEIRVELPADVLFDIDRHDIRPDAADALAKLATIARAYRGPVRLVGHTDGDGSDAYNLALSQRRAASVKQWLAERGTIDAARITTEGLGESSPRAPNDTPANKQLNRRVEAIIRK